MDKNINNIAQELYNKIAAHFNNVELRGADGKRISSEDSVAMAREFVFDFEKYGLSLGSVVILLKPPSPNSNLDIDDNTVSLIIKYSNGIVDGRSKKIKQEWYDFLKAMRKFAMQHWLNFFPKDVSKGEYRQNAVESKTGEKNMVEGKMWGSTRTSYQQVGEAKVIIKHSRPVTVENAGSRTRHINAIFIENIQGERFKYPYAHLSGARALASHISNGGTPYDNFGTHIVGLSEEIKQLKQFKNYVSKNGIISEAIGTIYSKVTERVEEINRQLKGLQTSRGYNKQLDEYVSADNIDIPEDIVNEWIDQLTIRNFNEDIKSVFPYIYKLVEHPIKTLQFEDIGETSSMDELVNKIKNNEYTITDIQDILSGEDSDTKAELVQWYESIANEQGLNIETDGDEIVQQMIDSVKNGDDVPSGDSHANDSATSSEDDQFESVMESIIHEAEAMATVPPNSASSLQTTNPTGETPSQLSADVINQVLNSESPAEELYGLLYQDDETSEILHQMVEIIADDNNLNELDDIDQIIDILIDELQSYNSEQESSGVVQPVTAGKYDKFAESLRNAITRGARPSDSFMLGEQQITLSDAVRMVGLNYNDFFNEDKENTEIFEYIKSMYNAAEGSFPRGERGVLEACRKRFGDGVTSDAKRLINELASSHEMLRIKELAGI